MSREDERRTLIAYDVPSDKRRARLAKTILSYGDRIQFSVFVVDISPAKLIQLKAKIAEKMDTEEDSVLFCDLGRTKTLTDEQFSFLGRKREVTDSDVMII